MARIKKTVDFLKELELKHYDKYRDLLDFYEGWKNGTDFAMFKRFLDTIWHEKDNLRSKYLSTNTYNSLRGIALEEYCYDILEQIIKDNHNTKKIDIFWNEKIKTEEFYIFENGVFKQHPKYKNVDLAIGISEGKLIHPFIIISCKMWQSANWLDEDRAVLDNIRNRYPGVLGCCLCMSLTASPVSLISSQRTGMRVYDLSKERNLSLFIEEVQNALNDLIL